MNFEWHRHHVRLRSPREIIVSALAAGLLAFVSAGALADQQPADGKPAAKPSRSLDQELLDDLDNELLDGTDKKLPRPKPAPAAKEGAPSSGDKEPAGKSGQRPPADDAMEDPDSMGEDIGQGPEDPLTRIGREMRAVERLIAEKQAAESATESGKAGKLQDQIVEELAKLIETLEKEQQQQQQSSAGGGKKKQQGVAGRQKVNQPKPASANSNQQAGAKNNQPARDSSERLGKNETQHPDLGQLKGLMKDLWGQLPAHAREQMLQTSPEQFLPRYELQIEKYYKRLAEQQKESH